MKLEVGSIYMVTLTSGLSFFGEVEWRHGGSALLGGMFAVFCPGLVSEDHIERALEFPRTRPRETQQEWLKRIRVDL